MSLDLRLPGSSAGMASATATTGTAGSRIEPAVNLDLASNNPFRNRATTPNTPPVDPSQSPSNPFFPRLAPEDHNVVAHNRSEHHLSQRDSSVTQTRPVSRNPFLEAAAGMDGPIASRAQPQSPSVAPFATMNTTVDRAADDLKNLELGGGSRANGIPAEMASRGAMEAHGDPVENVPPNATGRRDGPGPAGHRMTRSQEEDKLPYRYGHMPSPTGPTRSSRMPNVSEGSAEAGRAYPSRTLRRNSESSVTDVRSGPAADADDRKQRERRQRERRHRDGRPKKPSRKLDVIDKLDVTSIYGTVFHHDGPFDACNPHRNRTGSSRAPMQAFAKDSANNAIGGSGPVNKDIDRAQYMGERGADAFADFSQTSGKAVVPELYEGRYSRPKTDRTQSFDPVARVDPVHGDESLGLGTSTFLEGAPASKTAIQRRESEGESSLQGGGMSRKKSLAKKIQGLKPSRQYGPMGRSGSVDLKQDVINTRPMSSRDSYGPLTAPSGAGLNETTESNPFFSEFDPDDGKKAERVTVTERVVSGHERQPSSPRRGLERSTTHDSAAIREAPAEPKPSGFLSRVRSLRGGRRPRTGDRGF